MAMRNAKVRLLAVGFGAALLGYFAAGVNSKRSRATESTSPEDAAAAQEAPAPATGTSGQERQTGAGRGAEKPGRKPNIVVIMGDDIGWFNIGAYHQGMMSGKT